MSSNGRILDGKHIFVLEDDVTNLAIITSILRRHGAIVYFDVWGATTLAQMMALPKIDIILLDLMLQRTKLSGYDIFEQIQTEPRLEEIPVLLVTAADADVELPVARKKGFSGYIAKPINREVFGQQVADALDGKDVWVI
ncbi:MAG: response regulator [Anaerolineae bacterium]|nr:response regulator [Anaerolineae bacterium]